MNKKRKIIIIGALLGTAAVAGVGVTTALLSKNKNVKEINIEGVSFKNVKQNSFEIEFNAFHISERDLITIFLNDQKIEFKFNDLKQISNDRFSLSISNLKSDTKYTLSKIEISKKVFTFNNKFINTLKEDKKDPNEKSVTINGEVDILKVDSTSYKISIPVQNAKSGNYSIKLNDILVNGQLEEGKVVFQASNLTANTKYILNEFKFNEENIELPNKDISFVVDETTAEQNEYNINVQRITKNSATVIVTLDNIESANNFKLEVGGNQYNQTRVEDNSIIFQLDNLNKNTKYSITKLINVNNESKSLTFENQSFNTLNEENFSVRNIDIIEKSDENAKVKINFDTHVFASEENKAFQLVVLGPKDKVLTYSSDDYNSENGSITFELNNLEFSSNYEIKNLFINGKNISINNSNKTGSNWLSDSQNLVFSTNFYSKEITFASFSSSIDTSSGEKLILNFEEITNMFEMKEDSYLFKIEFRNKENNKTFYSWADLGKDKNNNLKNISFDLVDKNSFDYESEENLYELPKNSKLEILSAKIDKSDNLDVLDPRITIRFIGSESEINTDLTFDKYKNTSLSYEKSNKTLSVSTTIEKVDSSQPNSVQFELLSDFGASWTLNANKNENNLWSANIDQLDFNGKIYLSRVLIDSKNLRIDSDNKGTIEITNTTADQPIEISNISASRDQENNNYSIISLTLNKGIKELDGYVTRQPLLKIFEENDQNNLISADFISKESNTYKFKVFLNPNRSYKIKFANINDNYLYSDISFNVSTANNEEKTVDQLNAELSKITSLNMKQMWWAYGAKQKLINKSALMNLTNLSSAININDNVDVLIDTAFNKYDDILGKLSIRLKLTSGSNSTDFKEITINNLFSKNYFRTFDHNPDFYNQIIKVSKEGSVKLTSDFDSLFGEEFNDTNDLAHSFGNPVKWVELKNTNLSQFLDIDERFRSYDDSKFTIYFVKFSDIKNVYEPHQTTQYAMQGFMNYRINFWFDNYDANNKNLKPESKYKDASPAMIIGGFNGTETNINKDLWRSIHKNLTENSIREWNEFNSKYGFNQKSKTKTIDEIISEINNIQDKEQKWNKLLEYSNLKAIIDATVFFVKNSFNPPIAKDFFKFEVTSLEKITLGQNNYLKVNFVIKSILISSKHKNYDNYNIIHNKELSVHLLKK
ncbi:hypothetical protein MCANUF31_02910 [Mycoplasmopsis canis UF31]|uniref:hypothetical protein n=1 Tax=Mycoplasmopsis canis TaxID=29555 RepID=UPI00025AF005|nr:hypothetical protein [Mycoplasmopsis canis]EIE39617.1 hypothetical protein MCANUF31_02910 [Mycoplasmopsis canis UF31]